mmetsp:Transcript_37605/g.95050  ORF Transcript_37605/g.95050 Transcript_37605/m.95050 type:complete len:243 (-) Transcript_37605:244-972(-)
MQSYTVHSYGGPYLHPLLLRCSNLSATNSAPPVSSLLWLLAVVSALRPTYTWPKPPFPSLPSTVYSGELANLTFFGTGVVLASSSLPSRSPVGSRGLISSMSGISTMNLSEATLSFAAAAAGWDRPASLLPRLSAGAGDSSRWAAIFSSMSITAGSPTFAAAAAVRVRPRRPAPPAPLPYRRLAGGAVSFSPSRPRSQLPLAPLPPFSPAAGAAALVPAPPPPSRAFASRAACLVGRSRLCG